MTRKTIRSLAAVLAVSAAGIAAGASASAAQASVVVEEDLVRLTSVSNNDFTFGDNVFAFGVPQGSGDLEWKYGGGVVTPHLTGTLHLNNSVGDCARMRIDYQDADRDLLATRYGGTVCADDNGHNAWSVDLQPYSSAHIAQVYISIEKQTTPGAAFEWADGYTYSVSPESDSLKLTAENFDFGSSGWAFGAPTGSGELDWNLSGGALTPHLTGTLHINNADGGCARINLRYLSETGTFLTSRAGGTVCANDGAHHSWTVDLDPYTSNKIGKVKVQLQTKRTNGTYSTVESETVSVEA